MSDFHGVHRAADGTAYEYRGRLADRRPDSDDTENLSTSVLHRFHTEEGGAAVGTPPTSYGCSSTTAGRPSSG
ncbi:hypothetical protein SHKM778_13290 [Streptomyces sp. KM77-8]|uniref:OAA-family lectin sugar binding domain-containing protein n=1 Tax=Streptomyces haneummycinicus TaxID=3074435 RepID=A0AAT9HC14_9ACTN